MEHAQGSVAGVVLAGGLSTRMGHDKARLRLHGPDKPDLLARTHALLADLLPLCWVSCRADAPRSGYECLFDAKPGQGPAAGILAALRAAQAQGFAAVLALSCDMPLMDTPPCAGCWMRARRPRQARWQRSMWMRPAAGQRPLPPCTKQHPCPCLKNGSKRPGAVSTALCRCKISGGCPTGPKIRALLST